MGFSLRSDFRNAYRRPQRSAEAVSNFDCGEPRVNVGRRRCCGFQPLVRIALFIPKHAKQIVERGQAAGGDFRFSLRGRLVRHA